jgi:hypothetical protein
MCLRLAAAAEMRWPAVFRSDSLLRCPALSCVAARLCAGVRGTRSTFLEKFFYRMSIQLRRHHYLSLHIASSGLAKH